MRLHRLLPFALLVPLSGCAVLRSLIDCAAPAVAAGATAVQPELRAALEDPQYSPARVDALRQPGAGIEWAAIGCAAKALLDALTGGAVPNLVLPAESTSLQVRQRAGAWIESRGLRFQGER